MPQRAFRPCKKCGALTHGGYCTAHQGEPKRQAQRYDARRAEDPVRRLYGTQRWRWTSKEIIARDPVCKECHLEPSTLADHVIPSREYVAQHNGDLDSFFDKENLQGLGNNCHRKKSARDLKAQGYGGQAPEPSRRATAF
jgi:5-methylcytosine-specific restriction endonuclease McrA